MPPINVLLWYLFSFLALGACTWLWCMLYARRRVPAWQQAHFTGPKEHLLGEHYRMQTTGRQERFILALVIAVSLGIALLAPNYLVPVERPAYDTNYLFLSVHGGKVRISSALYEQIHYHGFDTGTSNDGVVIPKKGP